LLARRSAFGGELPGYRARHRRLFLVRRADCRASGAIVALLVRNESLLAFHQSSHMLGHSTLELICYVIVWGLQLLIIQNGMETVRKFQDWAGPAVWVMMLLLAVYLVIKAGGFSFGTPFRWTCC
jgi:cytosine/uracil/thiamine/allantoin permease